MARVNVYLPDALVERLREERRRGEPVDVSAVTRLALESVLGSRALLRLLPRAPEPAEVVG